MVSKRKGVTAIQRFLSKVKVNTESGCWEWQGLKDKDGYGKFTILYKDIRSHRFSYIHFIGELGSSKELVCHTCDNTSCVNPFHLFRGNNSDNMLDARLKGRRNSKQHGTKHCYDLGCRCDICKLYAKEKYREKINKIRSNPELLKKHKENTKRQNDRKKYRKKLTQP